MASSNGGHQHVLNYNVSCISLHIYIFIPFGWMMCEFNQTVWWWNFNFLVRWSWHATVLSVPKYTANLYCICICGTFWDTQLSVQNRTSDPYPGCWSNPDPSGIIGSGSSFWKSYNSDPIFLKDTDPILVWTSRLKLNQKKRKKRAVIL